MRIKLTYYGQSPPDSRIVDLEPGQLVRYRKIGNPGLETVGVLVEIRRIEDPRTELILHILGESGLDMIPRSHLYSIAPVQSPPGAE